MSHLLSRAWGSFGGGGVNVVDGPSLYTAMVAHPYAASVFTQLAPSIQSEWMFRDLSTFDWHANDRCPMLSRPFEHIRFAPDSLPAAPFERWLGCPHCEAALALPLGRLVAVLLTALAIDPTGVDDPSCVNWPLLASRRRFCFDPLSIFPFRLGPSASFWDPLRTALAEWVVSLSQRSAESATFLSPEPLYDALAAVTMPTTEEWLLGHPVALRHSSPGVAERFVDVFLVHPELPAFCEGRPVQKIVDLFALATPITAHAALVRVPTSLVPQVRAAADGSVPLDDVPDVDTLRWAASLYLTAPTRTLPTALSAARRLRRGPLIAVESKLQRPA
jgi:hypothetical protein